MSQLSPLVDRIRFRFPVLQFFPNDIIMNRESEYPGDNYFTDFNSCGLFKFVLRTVQSKGNN